MKVILLVGALLLPFHLFSQLDESFSGTGITSNNPWKGDVDMFGIDSGQLRFISPTGESGSASIYVPLSFKENMTWEMDVKLNFKSTDSNNLRIYIYKDGVDTIYIQAGNNARRVSLYEKEGERSATPRITGRNDLLDEPYLFVSIRLTLEEGRIWTLYTRKADEHEFCEEGSYKMSTPGNPQALMILACRYIKGRISEYLIDNLKVTHDVTDIGEPDPDTEEYTDLEILSAEILCDDELQFIFDKPVDISKAVCKIDNAEEASLSYGPTQATVNVCVPETFENGREYLIAIDGLCDLQGRRISKITWKILYEKEEDTPHGIPGQVRINEVMADPKGSIYFPETEYVELHNTSESTVSLKGWAFVYDGKRTVIDALSMPAGGYAILYKEGKPIHVDEPGEAVGLEKFPKALANDGKLLQLEDATGALMDELDYPKAKPGISWERVGDDIYLSIDTRGGTPGSPNSRLTPEEDPDDDNTTGISAPILMQDGIYGIAYRVETYDYRCRIHIYNMAGMRVAEIPNHELQGLSGEILWDGKSSSGSRLKTGVYIFHAELYNTSGRKWSYKKVFTFK
ncbi:MAG: lamin tail domain-containing protein [Tannerellaceae bacterium]|jgi:hypothetical protein|nr:lamin tail domain-containing protein [Tannerellaceae bacterium]